jgi:hypothetical protein
MLVVARLKVGVAIDGLHLPLGTVVAAFCETVLQAS